MQKAYDINTFSIVIEATPFISLPDICIRNLIIDSRKTTQIQDSVFFAIQGDRHNGHGFISELIHKGVKNFVVSSKAVVSSEANFFVVEDVIKALQSIATHHRKSNSIPILAITGSNGKTTIKEWIRHTLGSSTSIVTNPKSYNSQVGVPLSIWHIRGNEELGVFEAGISKKGEMKKLQRIISPDFGLITNIGDAHAEHFNNQEEKLLEKLILFKDSKAIFYCKDSKLIDSHISRLYSEKSLYTWGKGEECTLTIHSVKKNTSSSTIYGEYLNKEIVLIIPFCDKASIENAILCCLFALVQQIEPSIITQRMSSLPQLAMRLEYKAGIKNSILINDFYNSDLESLKIALEHLSNQKQKKNKSVILSDITESNLPPVALYQEVASLLSSHSIDKLIGIGDSITKNQHFFNVKEKHFFDDTKSFEASFNDLDFKDEVILLKGARSFELEKISQLLEAKTHETVLEVNLSHVVHNLNYFRSLLKPKVKIMCMVKAFSYGSGTYEIAQTLAYQNIDYLGVAYADEGVLLRKNGIQTSIMVMNVDQSSFDSIVQHNLEPEIYSFEQLLQFIEFIERIDLGQPYPIHLKIETGMNRLGFNEKDIDSLIDLLKQHPQIKVKCIFSHLAASDEPIHDDFTMEQLGIFIAITEKIEASLGYTFIKHIANSAAIERFPTAHLDMVRLGIGLHGISPFPKQQDVLIPVSTLKTVVSQVKFVDEGNSVGYGRKGWVDKRKKIATIPIGYADGFKRSLGNGVGHVFIHNQKVPVFGSVCMDMTMLDVTNVEVKKGDSVIIFDEHHSVKAIAKAVGTIPYEILSGISQRVKRIYFQE